MIELISAKDIDIQTKIVAKQISDEHKGDKTPVVMVGFPVTILFTIYI